MSNHLTIAAATSTFGFQLLQKAATVLPGAEVTIGRPKEAKDSTKGINVYLYQVTPNATLRNADLPTRRGDTTLVQRPQAALDLHYLLTFYGEESKFEPQILMGSTVRVLQAQPILTQDMIRNEIKRRNGNQDDCLAKSDLADQIERVKFTPISLNLEELSKLWSVFFQIPYTLSIAYMASVVLIEAEVTPQTALPVREPLHYAIPFSQPVIEKIQAKEGENVPIVSSSVIIISGRQLQGDTTRVHIDALEVTLSSADPVNTVSDKKIELSLGSALFTGQPLRAGVVGLQVLHPKKMGKPEVEHFSVESNVKPFVLHPTITGQQVDSVQKTLKLALSPKVGKAQRVMALLNELEPDLGKPRAAYALKAPSDNGITGLETETDFITFSVADVKAGTYLLRVQVDGAQSQLDIPKETDPKYPNYIGPTVTI